ncbi:uncharacterized protein LOC128472859 [Spea bombifrons]|uniref:uncharacterized protein LOC128472859 n=1 Tax=Spea bombifrons TaxID=233779 RepID=UPI0023493D1B|nr:uncharacterized protein LOC128472859 [Spea bombifrons]
MEQAARGPSGRRWTVPETRALLDWIRDMGFISCLNRKGCQNRHVFKRLHTLLGRGGVRVREPEVRARWRFLKVKFWRLKRLADAGLAPAPVIGADFPFYAEMEQLLAPQAPGGRWRREADSTGSAPSPLPSPTDSGEDRMADGSDLNRQEGELGPPRLNVDPTPDLLRDAPQEGWEPAPGLGNAPQEGTASHGGSLQIAVLSLQAVMQQLQEVMERMSRSLDRLSGAEERVSVQLGYLSSFVVQMSGASEGPQGPAGDQEPDMRRSQGSRAPRRSLRRKRPIT